MPAFRTGRAAAWIILSLFAGACASASSPWKTHDRTADVKARAADPAAQCPVVLANATDDLIEAGYVSLGVESVVGMIPVGHSLRLSVSCREGQIEAFAVSDGGLMDDVVHYRKLARLDLAQVTHLDITQADRVR